MAVPSEPIAHVERFGPHEVFERVRRETVGGRRCSPAANSFVAVDRVVVDFLAKERSTVDASGRLADLVRELFPAAYERHRRQYERLGIALEEEGRAREERVLRG